MNKLVYVYSLVKTFYEQEKDYMELFWSFVLKVLSTNKTPSELNLNLGEQNAQTNL